VLLLFLLYPSSDSVTVVTKKVHKIKYEVYARWKRL